MMREEFEKQVREIAGANYNINLSEQDYMDIEYVYTWHPAIGEMRGKYQIAWLYVEFGMGVIRDMYETASLNEDLTDDLAEARRKVRAIEDRIDRLKRGDKGYGADEED